jgi:hypothetical protein
MAIYETTIKLPAQHDLLEILMSIFNTILAGFLAYEGELGYLSDAVLDGGYADTCH